MLIAVPFTISRTWKQPNVHQQRNKENVAHTYTQWNISHKKELNCAICRDMAGPRECHIE